jgi:hypothetical protein
MRSLVLSLSIALSFVLAAVSARAEGADGATEKMRVHFGHGVELYDAHDYDGALVEFRAAYDAKAVAAIHRNVALTLKALHRYPEAIDTFERFLAEGGDTVKPDVRQAVKKEIADLSALIATVRVSVAPRAGALAGVRLFVDGVHVEPERASQPIRLGPGEHVFRAHAEGFADGEERKAVAAGDRDVPVHIELVPVVAAAARATLRVRANVPTADVTVDGGAAQRGAWTGEVDSGTHRVTVSAPGYAPIVSDVTLAPNENRDLPMSLDAAPLPPAPLPIEDKTAPPARARNNFFEAGLTGAAMTLHPAAQLGGDGAKQTWGGLGLALLAGHKLSRYFSIEGIGELAAYAASYDGATVPAQHASVSVYQYLIAPEIKFHTPGDVRFFGALALGVEGYAVDGTVGRTNVKGSGAMPALVSNVGLQFQLRKAFIELALVLDLHDASNIKDDQGQALFSDKGASRTGARVMVGYPF